MVRPDLRGRFHRPEEGLDRPALERFQLTRLRAFLAEILPRNPFQSARLSSSGLRAPEDLEDLAFFRRLPFTTKAEVQADQEAHPPFGTNLTYPLERYLRLHQTSGTTGRPLRFLDTAESWAAHLRSWGTIYRAAGLGPGDRVFFPFSFGPFIGFWAAFEGALASGMAALPGGGMSSVARLRFLLENGATVVCATPTYALRLAEVAREEGIDLHAGRVRALILAGEPGAAIPQVRRRLEEAWGGRVFDHWGMTEVGPLAFEDASDPGHLVLIETECIAEVVKPRSGEPAAPGEPGELVVTTMSRVGSPLLRYRTGDLVSCSASPGPTGRSFLRLEGGILGRLDDMLLVRGNNVYPSAVEAVLRGIGGVAEYQVHVQRGVGAACEIRVVVEPASGTDAARLLREVRRAFGEALCFRPEVEAAPPGSLPRFEMKARRFVYQEKNR